VDGSLVFKTRTSPPPTGELRQYIKQVAKQSIQPLLVNAVTTPSVKRAIQK